MRSILKLVLGITMVLVTSTSWVFAANDMAIEVYSSGVGAYWKTNGMGIGLSGHGSSTTSSLGGWAEGLIPLNESLVVAYGTNVSFGFGTNYSSWSGGLFFGFEQNLSAQFSVGSFTNIFSYSSATSSGVTTTKTSYFSSGLFVKYYF